MTKTLYFDGEKFIHKVEEMVDDPPEGYQVYGLVSFGEEEIATIAATLNNSNIISKIRQTKCQTEGNQE